MKKQWIVTGVLLGVLVASGILGVRLSPEIFPVGVGSKAPTFKAVNVVTGDSVTLDRYKGQIVILNIWATWCEPCRIEMPSMQRLHDALGPEGLKIVAISVDVDDAQAVKAFRRELGLTFDVLQDRTRAIERAYQTSAVPETFVLDRHGVIVKKIIGPHEWDSLIEQGLVKRLLAERR